MRKYKQLSQELAGSVDRETTLQEVSSIVEESVQHVVRWVELHDYRAYDPGDGSLSYLRHLTFDSHTLNRILTAVVLRAPFEIRPLLGIKPHTSTKGMAYMGWGYLKLYANTGKPEYRQCAEFCFDWLMTNRSADQEYYCWGNHFSFSTRAGTIPANTPTIVWSSLIALAFLDAFEVLGNPRYLEVAVSTAKWIMTLPRDHTRQGICLSYVSFRQTSIHNSNMLGSALLAEVATRTADRNFSEIARDAMVYSCTRQKPDGAWFYGEERKFHWVDSFHTGYNLDCLKRYIDSTGDREFLPNLKRGIEYFTRHFIGEDGSPKYYHDQTKPIDIQCAAQTIDTLSYYSDTDPECIRLAIKIALWTIDNMQAPDGHFYYRDLGWKKIKTPMLHWGQATMFKALAHLLSKI